MKIALNEEIYSFSQKSDAEDIFELRICGITHPDKNYEVIRNNSNVASIEYVEIGEGSIHINDKTFYPEAGDSYMLPIGASHHYYSDSRNPWKKYFIVISGTLTESLIEGYQLRNSYYFKELNIRDELVEIINIVKTNSEKDSTPEILCALNKIFFKMRMNVRKKTKSDISDKMKNYLNVNAESDFKIEDLCKYVSKSESHTIRIFKKAFGITPYAYVLNKKINLSKDLLINTNLSIKQISQRLNFTDEYYFSNIFKRKVGISPSVFRKNKI